MRLLLVFLSALLACSCSSGKPQYIPPPKPVEPAPVVQAEMVPAEVEEESVEAVPVDESSFLAILLKEILLLQTQSAGHPAGISCRRR